MPLAVGLAALVVLAAVVVFAARRDDGPSAGPGVAPDIRLSDLRQADAEVVLSTLRGKPVVVNFFASWCKPCREELPLLKDAHERLGDRVAFLGVAHLDDRQLALEMLDRYDIDYEAGFDPDGTVARRYRLRGLPSTAFIGADGKLIGVAAGQLDRAELDDWLTRLEAA